MKGNKCLINLLLLISITGVLALTASEYVSCKDISPDEFLDLAVASQYPISPAFAPRLNTHACLLRSLKIFYFQKINFLTAILRC